MRQEWWKESVVYQIYPKSFQDSNSDGIGDIPGIMKRLPYLRKLGVDVIWLCPIYRSPMIDGGYDIADYQSVDPMFGSDDDMERLIKEADKIGIKVLMDLVVNHTSNQHRWFQEALKDPDSKYRDYYIFRKGENGKAPNNWRSYFGSSAWSQVPGESDMYYLHAFAPQQPDLNWENEAVRKEIIHMVNWWLDKGLGGFRIDAILNLKKKIEYGQFTPDGEDGLAYIGSWILNQPGVGDWLKELDERTFRKHNSLTVAEADVPYERLEEYIGSDGYFRMVFDFSYTDIDVPQTGEWYKPSGWTIGALKEAIFSNELSTQDIGWGAKYLENHDQPRSINKYIKAKDINDRSKKMLATLFMMLHGTPFIYQGQELGMENVQMDGMEDYRDIATYDQYRRALLSGMPKEQAFEWMFLRSRDNSRTPMQWDSSKNAGFSDGETTWIKVNPNYQKINAADQEARQNSVLNYYRKLIALRKSGCYKDVIIDGRFEAVPELPDTVIAYKRVMGDREILVVINFSDKAYTYRCDKEYCCVLISNFDLENVEGNVVNLPSYGAMVLADYELEKSGM